MTERLDIFLLEEGYQRIPSNLPEFTIYYRFETAFVNVIHVIDYDKNVYIGTDQFDHILDKIRELFRARGFEEAHILNLIVSSDIEKAKPLCMHNSFSWIVDQRAGRLIIYEQQAPDFYGLRGRLEGWLNSPKPPVPAPAPVKPVKKRSLPVVTAGIVAANIIVYLICTITGDLLYNIGALNAERIVADGEYYRMITALFLHSGAEHLFNNMLLLFAFGEMVEKELGHIRFGILYLLAGIGGSMMSLAYILTSGRIYQSIGASGAVFGVEGALLMLVLVYRGRFKTVTVGKLAFLIVYSLYVGFRSTDVDNFAHLGGVVSGFAVCLAMYLIKWIYKKAGGNKYGR